MFWNMYHRWSAEPSATPTGPCFPVCDRRTGDPERREVSQVLAVDIPPSKNVDRAIDDRRSMSLARHGDVADARELGPLVRRGVKRPGIVVVVVTVSPAESGDRVSLTV
jgi:hypothetical protein